MVKIKIYNENKLTRKPFFKALIDYLANHDEVKLREIHKIFENEKNLDRQLEEFITSGLIVRADRRYSLGFRIFSDHDFSEKEWTAKQTKPVVNLYDKPFFVEADSRLAQRLNQSLIFQTLANLTNSVEIHMTSSYDLKTDTLANYFYKVAENLPLSALEQEIYEIIGDVDPEYALKYMTSFLLKFMGKEVVKARPDIFITVLEKYGYVKSISDKEFVSLLKFEEKKIAQKSFDAAESFIIAQIQQVEFVEDYLSIAD